MKINEQDLEKIQNNRNDLESVVEQLSELQLRQIILEETIKELKRTFIDLINREELLLSDIKEKYGDGLLDLDSGEIKISNGE